jgi:HD superfamily phosphohydrolase
MPKQQRIRDPLHDLIDFDEGSHLENVLWRVIQTRPFQRLRRQAAWVL